MSFHFGSLDVRLLAQERENLRWTRPQVSKPILTGTQPGSQITQTAYGVVGLQLAVAMPASLTTIIPARI